MNMKHYASIEQSKKLLEVGLNPDTADMCYHFPEMQGHDFAICLPWEDIHPDEKECCLPSWSVGALLEILNYPKLYKDQLGDEDAWFCECFIEEWNEMHQGSASESAIDAAYEMVVWLLENNYIKND